MALRPAQVHPEEHLGPVGRLGPAGARVDADERTTVVVGPREEEGGSLSGEVVGEGVGLAVELGRQLRVTRLLDEADQLVEVRGALEQILPEGDLAPEAVRLPEDPLGPTPVVPEAGLLRQRVELGDASLLRLEVKAAPRSTGSAP